MDTPRALTEGAYPLPQSPFERLAAALLGDKSEPHQIRVDATTLHIERRGWRQRRDHLPLETLTGLRVVRGKLGGLLTIEAGEKHFDLRLGRKTIPAEDFIALVRQRVDALDNGDLVLQTIAAREEAVAQLVRYRAWAIWLMVPLLACAYGVRYLREGSVFDLDYFGACARFWVMRGEVYRLLTGSWLHADLWHLGGNLLVIVWLGRAVERVLGAARLTVIMAASGLTAALGSLWLAPGGSIGASGIGMGLAASFAVIAMVYRSELPRPLAKPIWWWAIFAFLLMPTPDGPGDLAIDHAAHAMGALGGGLVTWSLIRGLPIARVRSRNFVLPAALCVLVHLVALAFFAYRTVNATTLGELARIDGMMVSGEVDADLVNELTWAVAIDPKADLTTIHASLALAEKAAHREPGEPALADTVATLHHRAGSDRRAVELETRAIELGEHIDDATIQATQLARFMNAASDELETHGVQLLASDRALHVTFDDDAAGDALRYGGVTVYAVATRNGQIQGVVRVFIAAGGDRERVLRVGPEAMRGGALIELATPIGVDVGYGPLFLRSGCPQCRKGSAEVTVWPVDPDVLAWP